MEKICEEEIKGTIMFIQVTSKRGLAVFLIKQGRALQEVSINVRGVFDERN